MEYDYFPIVKVGNLQVADTRREIPDWRDFPTRNPADVTSIIIHHTDTNRHEMTVSEEIGTLKAISSYHVNTQGWPGIGYHLSVFPSGNRYFMGGIESVRYHTGSLEDRNNNGISDANDYGVGLVMVGAFSVSSPTDIQLRSAAELIANYELAIGRGLSLKGHKDYVNTDCPGDTWEEWKGKLRPVSNDYLSRQEIIEALHTIFNDLDRIQFSGGIEIDALAEHAKQEGVVRAKRALGLQ